MPGSFSSCRATAASSRPIARPTLMVRVMARGSRPSLRAPVVERRGALREHLRRQERHVPAVGVAGDDAQQALLALAADPEPEARLHRARIAERVGQMDLLAVEGDALAVEESAQHDRGLLELIEAVLDRQERHPEGAELVLVPARAEAELDAARRSGGRS